MSWLLRRRPFFLNWPPLFWGLLVLLFGLIQWTLLCILPGPKPPKPSKGDCRDVADPVGSERENWPEQ